MLKFVRIYAIATGACMLVLWCMLLITGQVSELATEPYRITAHLSSEVLTALMLIGGGVIAVKTKQDNVLLNTAMGALLYSVLTAGGYYLQKGNTTMIVLFGILTALTTACIYCSIKHNCKATK